MHVAQEACSEQEADREFGIERMLNHACWAASCVAPFSFSLVGQETLKPEEGAACLTGEGVFEVFKLRGVGGCGSEIGRFVEKFDYGDQ